MLGKYASSHGYRIFLVVLIAIMLCGCGSSNKFAASFGKRKYMKGYYMDKPEDKELISTKEPNKVNTTAVQHINPVIAVKQAMQAAISTKLKEANTAATKLVRTVITASGVKTLSNNKQTAQALLTVNNDDTRQQKTKASRIGGIVLFIVIFLTVIAVLGLLAAFIYVVAAPYKLILFVGALLILLSAIILLIVIAEKNEVPGDLAVPLIEALLDAFFTVLFGLH